MEENNDNKTRTVVEVIDFGPLKITGNFILKDLKKNQEDASDEVWLCRCGKSRNKPYCDDSHKL
jgi:CDGSH-type Zn-finger protein